MTAAARSKYFDFFGKMIFRFVQALTECFSLIDRDLAHVFEQLCQFPFPTEKMVAQFLPIAGNRHRDPCFEHQRQIVDELVEIQTFRLFHGIVNFGFFVLCHISS